jgi:hypothetical protein
MSTIIDYDPEGTAIRLPDGRVAHLFHHHCESCTSLDVYTTTPGRPEHRVTVNGEHRKTGDDTHAPMGMFGFAGGSRWEMAGGADDSPLVPYNRATLTTAVMIWSDGAK